MISISKDKTALNRAVAELIATTAQGAIGRNDSFTIILAGGDTPGGAYQLLTMKPYRSRINWLKVHVFWGDERCVPANDTRSNFAAARQQLLSLIPVPESQIHPIDTTMAPGLAAESYDQLLRDHLAGSGHSLDLVLLGVGEDGHTASLFPGSSSLSEQNDWAVATIKPGEDISRITLTTTVLNKAHRIAFMVSGGNKSAVCREILQGSHRPEQFPAQLIRPEQGELLWFMDRFAAAQLNNQ